MLQMIIRMIGPPPCSSVPLQKVVCKEEGSSDDQNHGDGGARIIANNHLDDLASSVPLQRDGARIVANDHLDDLASLAEIRTRPATCRQDPKYKISAQTDQQFRR